MVCLRDQKGAALVTALMLTLLALVISSTLLYTVMAGSRLSASHKRYRTALAAAKGGVEVLGEEIVPRLFQLESLNSLQSNFASINLHLPQYDCLRQKIDTQTSQWTFCAVDPVPADPSVMPDATFKLSSNQGRDFQISAKIVDTVPGNSDKSGMDFLELGGSVASRDEIIHPRHVPAIYNLSVQGVREGGANQEKARLSVLYAY
ncbi:pilus assembly protein PilX [Geomonas sp.]|uniref:pilus assembly protein PilX n=1 Tax=Geomonas sp. TaxID=2651584 RepID=UPI002B4723DA|nr:pilus assembly protein PilX [Geomonas sp.]HJV36911.1 pilus assembly protein PilX [Geomonas sp.]